MGTTVKNNLADVTGIDERAVTSAPQVRSVYVYEAPVRIWHWINASAILVLCITGYLIGSPLSSVSGEASDHFQMGYIRFAHFAAGYVFAVGLIGRVYWAFVGNHHAREMVTLPVLRLAYWREVWAMLSWYLFLRPRPNQYVGHNPMARLMMFVGYFLVSIFMLVTGFALYGEGLQTGSWADKMFGWVIPLLGQSQGVHTWHHLGMWAMVLFVIVHIYAAIREDIMGRQSIVSTMISGYRTFKD
ncbi:MAG: Ni/Fe-hydrogenase, b-type cytochrome subunit [Giesbergeria sp.]|jgi:Ni/Fe-hydrogenase 1 B-type cytochrome subunit|nr:Ni/Fe-hydrogenase, b-type cytochrome subunit [Giesbergeria sp.]MBP6159320.1 Ni/Fe-hydrogenase, b-type cytochrome subunit [Giesbergeria sp.]MBP7083216.1 Ni/Fe-hydrogenase, b-type cytochrome subunit [Giesbergeria sp.]MBP9783300.1 Ni/Fe-hydrogenase, b-type cytochrome subunit [Giesbergeria sp.]MBP9894597.1 Ni/Fe-hydrogenase, b-type cytochrome subunit [Giesbergeria sp.]